MFRFKTLPKRVKVLVIIAAVLWGIIIIRLCYLQIFKHEYYKAEVAERIQRENTIAASRGIIYDANMNQLATNKKTYRVFVAPKTLISLIDKGDKEPDSKDRISRDLAEILSVDEKEVRALFDKSDRMDETVKKEITDEEYEALSEYVKENELTTVIHFEEYSKRYYPYANLAANVIGYEGTDGGLFGLELEYDDELTGKPGNSITARNGSGYAMPFKYNSYIDAQDGFNIQTTLNIEVQKIVQDQLKETYDENHPLDRVTAIVQNVKTGGIVAMATYPDFDLNDPYKLDEDAQAELDELGLDPESKEYNEAYWTAVNRMWRNKPVNETYEPGSTFKIITAAMALDSKVSEIDDTYYCGGFLEFDGYDDPIKCWVYPSSHGTITFGRGLQQSCNVTFMSVAAKIGRARFYDYFNEFGYTEKTGIDLPGEAGSIWADYANFNAVELAVYSFGQTFKVTPVQHITAISAIANGGYLLTPHIVSKITDSNGNVIKSFDTDVKRQVVSSETCKILATTLAEGVATDGGAKNTYVEGYSVAAKTGTSQKRENLAADGSSESIVASCVAYAPSYDPQYAILLLLDDPYGAEWGSMAAAPYVANIISEAFPVLGVPKSGETESTVELAAVPDLLSKSVESATASLEKRNLIVNVIGDGSTVTAQMPPSGSILESGNGMVYLYTGYMTPENSAGEVPDVVGLSSEVASMTLNAYGFNCNAEGRVNSAVEGAVVTSQSPAAGEYAAPGTIVTVKVRFTGDGDG